MKNLLIILSVVFLNFGCDLFEDDETTASTATSSSDWTEITCDMFNDTVDTSVLDEYGVEASCEDDVLAVQGSDLTASFSSSCGDVEEISVTASDLYLGLDISDVEYSEEEEDIRGDIGFEYNITVSEITNLPNVTGINCEISFEADAGEEEQEYSLDNISEFGCDLTVDGSSVSIDTDDIVTLGEVLSSDIDCDDEELAIAELATEEEYKLAIKIATDMINELLSNEFGEE